MRRCLIVFAKEPVIGKVKTRLSTHLSQTECIKLYKSFLKYTIELARHIKCNQRIVAYDSGDRSPDYLEKIAADFKFYKQKGKNLGERMHNAFKFALKEGDAKVVIMGSDAPTLSSRYIKDAFKQLDKAEVVLGPTIDGGYYLIGLKSPCMCLFEDITWSSKTVFADTLKNIKSLKKTLRVLPYWYDVDDSEALIRLGKDLKEFKSKGVARQTKKYLNSVIQLTDKNYKIV